MTPRPRPGPIPSDWVAIPRPPILAGRPESGQVLLDVREDLRAGREPFAQIMSAVDGLAPDAVLILRAPFEPVPLYGVLGRRGFAHWTERHGPEDWAVWFYPRPEPASAAPAADASPAVTPPGTAPPAAEAPEAGAGTDPPGPTIRLDVRGLEPPLPMVRVLECLDRLEPGQRLEVLHDRQPVFLYPQLDDRGVLHETTELAPGLVRIVIRREGGRS